MADTPNVATMVPAGGNVSTPPSGTYGDKASSDKLKAALQLPSSGSQPPEQAPMSALPATPKPTPSAGPFGLPQAITNPTAQPGVPVGTPLAQPQNPVAGAAGGQQQRMALLDMLIRNPQVSDTTREWAQTVLRKLIDASRS